MVGHLVTTAIYYMSHLCHHSNVEFLRCLFAADEEAILDLQARSCHQEDPQSVAAKQSLV